MTIDKAIEILELGVKISRHVMAPDIMSALKLGIEALKRLKLLREGGSGGYDSLLPGETYENTL